MTNKICKIFIAILVLAVISLSFLCYDLYKQNNLNEKTINILKEEINRQKEKNSITVSSNNENNDSNASSRLNKISLEELETLVQNKETFILVITQTTCGHCITYKPTLISVLEETAQIAYEVDIQPMTKEEKERVYKIAKVSGTPTTVFIEEGEEKNLALRLSGSVSAETLKQRLRDTGYIK